MSKLLWNTLISNTRKWDAKLEDCDAIEISAMQWVSKTACEPCDNEADADFWSVFFHLKVGGRVCFADCKTKHAAHDLGDALVALTGFKCF